MSVFILYLVNVSMIPFGREFLVSDTVPFLSKKPHIYLPHQSSGSIFY